MHIARLMIEIIIIAIGVNLKQEKLVDSSVKWRIKTTTLMFLVP